MPNDAAPSERTPYGRTVYKLIATAGGLGKIGTNLTAEREVTISELSQPCQMVLWAHGSAA